MFKIFSKKDFTNAKWLVAEKLLQLIAAIYIVPKIYNELGSIDIGKLEFSKSLIGIIAPALFLGLSVICVRELIFTPQKKHEIIATAFVLRLISYIFVIGSLFVYVYFTQESEISIILLIIGLGYFLKIADVFEYYIQAIKNSEIIFWSKLITLFVLFSLQYYGVTKHYSVYYFAGLVIVDFLITGLIYTSVLWYKKEINFSKLTFSFPIAKHLLKSAYPLIISNFIIGFYIGIDELFIKYYLGDAANGSFAAVQFLVIALTWNIGWGFILAIYPALVEVYKTDEILYAKRLRYSYLFMIVFGLLISVFYFFMSEFIILTFYNEQYQNIILPVQIFSWSPLFIFIGVIYEKHLVNCNQLHKNIYRFILGCFVNILLCYILIPLYQLNGAAIAVLISHAVTNLGWVLFDKESRQYLLKTVYS